MSQSKSTINLTLMSSINAATFQDIWWSSSPESSNTTEELSFSSEIKMPPKWNKLLEVPVRPFCDGNGIQLNQPPLVGFSCSLLVASHGCEFLQRMSRELMARMDQLDKVWFQIIYSFILFHLVTGGEGDCVLSQRCR